MCEDSASFQGLGLMFQDGELNVVNAVLEEEKRGGERRQARNAFLEQASLGEKPASLAFLGFGSCVSWHAVLACVSCVSWLAFRVFLGLRFLPLAASRRTPPTQNGIFFVS